MIRLLIYMTILFSSASMASGDAFQIASVESEADEQSSLVTIRYKGAVPSKGVSVEEHGTFIQVKVPTSIVPEPGKFYDADSPYIRKVALFQIDESTAGVRLFVTQDTSTLAPSLSTEFLNDRLLIHLDHKTVKAINIDDSPAVEEVIAKTEVRTDIPDPAKVIAAASSTNSHQTTGLSEELNDKLTYITLVSAFFLLLVIASVFIRKISAGKTKETSAEYPAPSMKTLATHTLAPKQNLNLMEICGQKILLAVSPEGINYLTTIEGGSGSDLRAQIDNSNKISFKGVEKIQAPQAAKISAPPKYRGQGAASTMESIRNSVSAANPQISQSQEAKPAKTYEGVQTSFSSQNATTEEKSIEDVTKLIRSKLKNLPSV